MGFFDFAATETNNLRPIQIGLCVLEVPQLPAEKLETDDDEPPKPPFDAKDPYLEKMRVDVVEEAWVMLFPAPASNKTMILCRTTKQGQLVRIERGEIDAGVPDGDKKRRLFVNEGATYLCLWSYHKALFKRALADVDKNLSKARRRNPFFEFEARPWKREKVFDAEFNLRSQAGQHDHDKLSFLLHNLGAGGHGYMSYAQLVEANVDPTGPYKVSSELFKGMLSTQCWIFARRPSLCTTYLAEFAARYAVRQRELSVWHYTQFHTALSFIDAAEKKRRVEKLDKQLYANMRFGSISAPQTAESLEYAEQYWNFAWWCATKKGVAGDRMDRDLFKKAVTILANNDAWKKAAFEIAEKYRIAHPAYLTKDGTEVDDHLHYKWLAFVEPVLSYFDLYRFGADQAEKPWVKHLAEAEAGIGLALQSVGDKLRQSFEAHGGYCALLQDLAIHVKDDDARASMHKRYLDGTVDSGYNFWRDLPGKKPEGAEKDDESGELEVGRPDPLLDIKPYVDVAFVSAAKQGEILGAFFDARGRALANRINEAGSGFDELFSKMINLDEKILKSKLTTIKTEDIQLEADFAAKKIVIHKEGKPIGEFEFVVEETGAKTKVRVASRKGNMRTETRKLLRAKSKDFEPLKEFEHAEEGKMKLPSWFAAFGYAVLIAYDLYTLKEQLKEKEGIEVYGRLGVNCGLGIKSLSEAFELTFHGQIKNKFIKGAGEAFGKFGKVAEKGAVVVEMVLTAREGAILLFVHEDSEVSGALEEGNLKVAYAQEAKGIVLLGGALGAGTVAIIAGSIATGGVVLAGVAITVAIIDLYSWLESDGSSMKKASTKLNKALGQELGSDYSPFRADERYDKCRTHERLERLAGDLERVEKLVAASR